MSKENEIETEGKSVTIAVEEGLQKLNLHRDEVEVTVLEEGVQGFLGMGSKPARVRIRRKRWEDDSAEGRPQSEAAKEAAKLKPAPIKREPKHAPAAGSSGTRSARPDAEPVTPEAATAEAKVVLEELLKLMGISYESVTTAWDPTHERVRAEVESEDGSLLVGKEGRTLESIQFLVTIMVGRRLGQNTAIQVEAEGYWRNLEGKITQEAERAAKKVQTEGGVYRFEPMDPALRRLIHRTLADNPDVETVSEGEGSSRKVVVKAK